MNICFTNTRSATKEGFYMKNILEGIKIIKYKGKEFIVDDELINTMLSILTSDDIRTSEEVVRCKEA